MNFSAAYAHDNSAQLLTLPAVLLSIAYRIMSLNNTAKHMSAREKIVQDTVQLDLLRKQATLGFCRYNIVNPGFPMIENRWNDRKAEDDAVKKLEKSLESIGMQITRDTSAIPLGLEPSWIAKDSLVKSMEGLMPDQLPILKLTEDGERAAKAGRLEAFQGGHRKRAATALYNKAIETEKRCEKALKRVERKNKSFGEEDIKSLTEQKEKAIKDQAVYSMWSYCIINTSKSYLL